MCLMRFLYVSFAMSHYFWASTVYRLNEWLEVLTYIFDLGVWFDFELLSVVLSRLWNVWLKHRWASYVTWRKKLRSLPTDIRTTRPRSTIPNLISLSQLIAEVANFVNCKLQNSETPKSLFCTYSCRYFDERVLKVKIFKKILNFHPELQ